MKTDLDLAGIGIGPFNLSLAALLSRLPEVKSRFFEQRPHFSWHSEIMFRDSVMQTSYLKDLVTPVDPTNPFSFLNYLVKQGLFYAHLNTSRTNVDRAEFEQYCQWVSSQLTDHLSFNSPIEDVQFKDGMFHVSGEGHTYTAKNLCIGTGMSPWVPEFTKPLLGKTLFHAKSSELKNLDLTGKRLVIIGGGQTGVEIFRNAFNGRWGEAQSVNLVSRRHTLEPLDETPFTNEYFSPGYVKNFYHLDSESKTRIVHHQRLASDGNTPFYLQELYNELYRLKYVQRSAQKIKILPQRKMVTIEKLGDAYHLGLENMFTAQAEKLEADVVILCTGFRSLPPKCLNSISHLIHWDQEGNFKLKENFTLDWKHADQNKIYALNFGRFTHGIAEPQTSLMAWRSATVINDMLGRTIYSGIDAPENFVQHGPLDEM